MVVWTRKGDNFPSKMHYCSIVILFEFIPINKIQIVLEPNYFSHWYSHIIVIGSNLEGSFKDFENIGLKWNGIGLNTTERAHFGSLGLWYLRLRHNFTFVCISVKVLLSESWKIQGSFTTYLSLCLTISVDLNTLLRVLFRDKSKGKKFWLTW